MCSLSSGNSLKNLSDNNLIGYVGFVEMTEDLGTSANCVRIEVEFMPELS